MEKTAEEKNQKTYKNRYTKQSRDTVNVGGKMVGPCDMEVQGRRKQF